MLKPLEVKTVNIATKAITSDKIADSAIETRHIKEGAVTPDKLTITPVARPLTPGLETTEIKDAAITSTKLAPNAVTTDHIAANAVATDDIKDGSITTSKIRDGAITRDKVADQSVRTEDLIDGAVTYAKLATNSVTQSKIAANAVGSSELQANSVGSSELQNNAVTTDKIGDGQVTQAKLAPGVGGGETTTFLMPSVDALYLTDISADIPYTPFDLSSWIPANAKAVILQLGIFNQTFTSGRAFFRVRTNELQRDALGVGVVPGQSSMVANQGILPITNERTIEYALESVGGPWVATFTLYITVVGYIL